MLAIVAALLAKAPRIFPTRSEPLAPPDVRVSTEGQAAERISLAAQRSRIAAWAASRGARLVATHADEGISGRRADNRPGLQTALEEACRSRAVLVAYDLTRLARSTRDAIDIADRLQKAGSVFADGTRGISRLGSGSTSVAFLVERGSGDETARFVLKVASDPDHDGRIEREAEILRGLDDQHVTRFVESFEVGPYRGFLTKPAARRGTRCPCHPRRGWRGCGRDRSAAPGRAAGPRGRGTSAALCRFKADG
ncbi:MAG: recombinase family protein [Planctomycetota bacterium]